MLKVLKGSLVLFSLISHWLIVVIACVLGLFQAFLTVFYMPGARQAAERQVREEEARSRFEH